MIPFRDRFIACALAFLCFAGLASAGEVQGDLACCRKPTTSGFRSCYDPCEPVGPIRRFFRSVFRVPCPPPRPVVVPVAVMRPNCPPGCPPAGIAAPGTLPGTLPAAPPVDIGRPVPVNPPVNVPNPPSPTSSFGLRPQPQPVAPRAMTPTPRPAPVPLDRLASRSGAPIIRAVAPESRNATLVHTTQPGVRLSAKVDPNGRVVGDVPEGEWLVYTTDTGKYVYVGKLVSRQGVTAKTD